MEKIEFYQRSAVIENYRKYVIEIFSNECHKIFLLSCMFSSWKK